MFYAGHMLWVGPLSKIWSDSQCEFLGHLIYDLEKCKQSCLGTTGFNALNRNVSGCSLMKCESPIPEPTKTFLDFKGYFITQGIG